MTGLQTIHRNDGPSTSWLPRRTAWLAVALVAVFACSSGDGDGNGSRPGPAQDGVNGGSSVMRGNGSGNTSGTGGSSSGTGGASTGGGSGGTGPDSGPGTDGGQGGLFPDAGAGGLGGEGGTAGEGGTGGADASIGGSGGSGGVSDPFGGTGGSPSSSCTLTTTVASCDDCIYRKCDPECVACEEDSECAAIIDCVKASCFDTDGKLDAACADECRQAHPGGRATLSELIGTSGCASGFCAGSCQFF